MKRKNDLINVSNDSILLDNTEDVKLYKGIMNQKIGKKTIVLSEEISKKKRIINRLFKEKFGKNFIPIKLESLKAFESLVKFFLFNPNSKFLKSFPKLRKHLLKERKINNEVLKNKIDCGSLVYLSLNDNGSHYDKNINEKYFQISKNLTTSYSKDIISTQFYKEKYLKKNTERIKKILSYKELKNKNIENKKNHNINVNFNINEEGRNHLNNNFSLYKFSNKTLDDFYKQTIDTEINTNKQYLSSDFNDFSNSDKNKSPLNTINYMNINTNNNMNINTNRNLTTRKKFSTNILRKHASRNFNLNSLKLDLKTSNTTNNDFSSNIFKPSSTCSYFKRKKNILLKSKQSKIFTKDFNKYVQVLKSQTTRCNNNLIKLIDGNIKPSNVIRAEKVNKEVLNLKQILMDKKDITKKIKINNINQIKKLINKAKLDQEGEATLEKIKKKELENFGHYLNEMNDEYALYKISELYNKSQLKQLGRTFFIEELERIRKKKIREMKVFKARKNTKENYLKMLKMKTSLSQIKDKFDKTDANARRRNEEKC